MQEKSKDRERDWFNSKIKWIVHFILLWIHIQIMKALEHEFFIITCWYRNGVKKSGSLHVMDRDTRYHRSSIVVASASAEIILTRGISHWQRILVVTFCFVNGLNPAIFYEWAELMNLARDQSGVRHFHSLFR
jgi:hypothetical protein